MSYSVNSDTKVATYEGEQFNPKHVTTITTDESGTNTQTSELVAQTEDECKEMKALRDAVPAYYLQRLREKRNLLLVETDWSRGDDVPDSLRNKYTEYRQKLRDITKTYNSIEDVTWPTKPS